MYSYDHRLTREASLSVKRLGPETVLQQVQLSGGRTVGLKSPRRVSYAVVDGSGRVVFTKNALTGKPQEEVYLQRATAEAAAKFLESSGDEYTVGEVV